MFQESACIYFLRQQRQTSRTQRKLFVRQNLRVPPEAYVVLSSDCEPYPVQAKIPRLDSRSLVCSLSKRDRSQLSRQVFSETLPNPHLLLFGHNTHQRRRYYRGRRAKHHFFVDRLCNVRHSFLKLKIK